MNMFSVRVELHDASYWDYEALHGYMQAEGYSRYIKGDDGKLYQLPPAEYYGEGDVTVETAMDAAKRAATNTGKSFAVLITEGPARRWWNLSVVG